MTCATFENLGKRIYWALDRILDKRYPDSWHTRVERTPTGVPGTADKYEKRILELADGRPFHAIMETLYIEDVIDGSWVTDQRLWNSLWEKSITGKMEKLETEGCLELKMW